MKDTIWNRFVRVVLRCVLEKMDASILGIPYEQEAHSQQMDMFADHRSSRELLLLACHHREWLDAIYLEILDNEGYEHASYEGDEVFLGVMNGEVNNETIRILGGHRV